MFQFFLNQNIRISDAFLQKGDKSLNGAKHFQRKTLCFFLTIIIFFLQFLKEGFLENASIVFHEIFTSDTFFFYFKTSLPVSKYQRIFDFYMWFCPDWISKTGKDKHLKFLEMIEKRLKLCKIGFKCI